MLSALYSFYSLEEKGATVKSELIAALSTFLAMMPAVMIAPQMLSKSGMDFGSALTATLLAATLSTLLIGFLTNYPFALAPGIALQGLFAHAIIKGTTLSWQGALAAAFAASVILIILNITGLRQLMIEKIPRPIQRATVAGCGLMLALTSLKKISPIKGPGIELLTLGERAGSEALLIAIGIILAGVLLKFRVRGAPIVTLLFIWSSSLALGMSELKGFFALPSTVGKTLFQPDFAQFFSGDFFFALLSLLFAMLFDAAGSLLSLTYQHGSLTEEGRFPHMRKALFCDASGTIASALLGSSPVTNYLESGAGMLAGGKTGLTSLFTGCLLLLSLFFAPLFASIPEQAIAPLLFLVGAAMARAFFSAPEGDLLDYLPAFATLVTIPLAMSIPEGICTGLTLYLFMKLLSGEVEMLHWIHWAVAALYLAKQFGLFTW